MADSTVPEPDSATPRASASGVRDIIERSLLLGLGAASLTMDRIQAVADDFVRRGQLSREEGRQLVQDLEARSKGEARSVLSSADATIKGAYRELGLATRRDLEDLDFRMRQLEHRINLLERQVDTEVDYDTGA